MLYQNLVKINHKCMVCLVNHTSAVPWFEVPAINLNSRDSVTLRISIYRPSISRFTLGTLVRGS